MADVGWIVAFSSVCGSWCLQQEASVLERCQTPAIPMSGGNSLLLTCKPVGFSTPEAIPACFVTGWNSPSFWCVRTPQQCHNSLWPPRQQQKGCAEPWVPTDMHPLSIPLPSPVQGSLLISSWFSSSAIVLSGYTGNRRAAIPLLHLFS